MSVLLHLLKSLECNPAKLTVGTTLPSTVSIANDVTCGASYNALGIEGGVVCYSGTQVGSIAIYFCFECGYKTLLQSATPLIRTCGVNGQWNGSIPQCALDCSKSAYSKLIKTI